DARHLRRGGRSRFGWTTRLCSYYVTLRLGRSYSSATSSIRASDDDCPTAEMNPDRTIRVATIGLVVSLVFVGGCVAGVSPTSTPDRGSPTASTRPSASPQLNLKPSPSVSLLPTPASRDTVLFARLV